MKIKVKVIREVEVINLMVKAGIRYWEDAKVDEVKDVNGDLIPCRVGDYWRPLISLEDGLILNWNIGVEARIHYKVCDDGEYSLIGKDGEVVKMIDGYVPKILCPEESGYGDYIIMDVNKGGYIKGWKVVLKEFENYGED